MAGTGVQLWWSTDHERPWWPVMALESGLGGRSWSPAVVVHGSREALVARDGVGGPALVAGAGVQLWWSTDHERPWWPVMALESGLGGRSWRPAVVVHGSREALVARDGVGERPWWLLGNIW